ncbi:MAG: hypothetical protein QGI24_10775 [Kiritimatiellia bacterium]|nr:hypothetical protein [Kiritimatiellia bacterium]
MERHKRKRIASRISNFIWSAVILVGLLFVIMYASRGCTNWADNFMSIF